MTSIRIQIFSAVRARIEDECAILFLFLWPVIFFQAEVLGSRAFAGDDVSSLFLPAGYELARALAQGHLPLWTSQLQSGFPLFAEGHVAALYLPGLLFYALLPPSQALACTTVFHMGWASVGMYLFARMFGLRIPSALLAGFVFGFNGFMLAHLQHLTLLNTAAWLPWLLLCQWQCQRSVRTGAAHSWMWFLGASVIIAFEFLGGFPQIALINLCLFFLVGILTPILDDATGTVMQILRKQNPQVFLKAFGVSVACAALGFGIAAVQWIPSAELLGLSVRAEEMGEDFATSYSMAPESLPELVLPFARLGIPSINNIEYLCYIGLLTAGLAFIAVFWRRDRRSLFFLLLALVFLSLSLGGQNPFYWLLSYVPVFNRLRVPARFLFPVTFAVSYLAGAGFDTLLARVRQAKRASDGAAAVVAGALAILVVWVVRPEPTSAKFWVEAWRVLPAAFIVIDLAILLAGVTRRVNRAVLTFALLAVAFADLSLASLPFLTTLDASVAPGELIEPPLSVQAMKDTSPGGRIFTNIYNVTFRSNHLLVYDRQSPQIYSPLGQQRNETYQAKLNSTMLDLLNVRYFVLPSGPLIPEFAEPSESVLLDLFERPVQIAPRQTSRVEVISYTDQTNNLPDGHLVGEIELTAADGRTTVLPLRLGVETADWARDGIATNELVHHATASVAARFPAYLLSSRRQFEGYTYIAQYSVSPMNVTRISARSYLPEDKLVIQNVSLIDSEGRSARLTQLAGLTDMSVAFKSHAVTVLENHDVMPRAFVVHQSEIWTDEHIFDRLTDSAFDPRQTVLLAEGEPTSSGPASPAQDQVVFTEYGDMRVVLQVAADAPGYLVLADSWYPGWQAFVDGQVTPVLRADYIFRAVAVPKGEHTIVMEFHPSSFQLGAWISGLSLLLAGGVAIVGIRKMRSAPPSDGRADLAAG